MNKIGKHNYEAFVLDYIEGNLNEAGINALFAFFEAHPDLKPDAFEDIESVYIDPPSIIFEEKNALKHNKEEREEKVIAYLEGQLSKTEMAAFEKELQADPMLLLLLNDYQKTILSADTEFSFAAKKYLKRTLIPDEILIAYSEGILTAPEKTALEKQLETDAVAKDIVRMYQSTKLYTDTSVVYPDKASLKRRGLVIYLNEYWKPLAVAASVILLFGLFWLFRGTAVNEQNKQDGSLVIKKDQGSKTKQPQLNSDTAVNQVIPLVAPHTYQYAVEKNSVQKDRQNLQVPVQKDPIDPDQQPVVNTNNQVAIDTLTSKKDALAMVNLDKNNYLVNYYDDTDEDQAKEQSKTISTKEYVAMKLNQAAWGEESEQAVKKEPKKRLGGFDVLALIGKGLKKLGNKHSDAKKVELENGNGSEYVVTIGGVSVTRKAAN